MRTLQLLSTQLFGFVLLILALLGNTVQAQSPNEKYWGEVAIGPGTIGGASVAAAFNYQRNGLLITGVADGQYSDDWFSEDSRSLWEYGALAGIASIEDFKPFFASLSAGIALTLKRRCTENCGLFDEESEWDRDVFIGLPIQGRISWRLGDYLGIGILGMANINAEEPFGSINLSLQIGDMG